MKQVWMIEDGELFDSEEKALRHEGFVRKKWLEEMPSMDLNHIYQSFKNEGCQSWVGTEKEMAAIFVDKAYQLYLNDKSLVEFKRRHASPG